MSLCRLASNVTVGLSITAATIIATPVSAVTRFVDASTTVAQPPTGTLGWGNPYKYLSDALAAALTGDEIWIKGNLTYYPDQSAANPNGTGDAAASFVIPVALRLIGGFAGTELESS